MVAFFRKSHRTTHTHTRMQIHTNGALWLSVAKSPLSDSVGVLVSSITFASLEQVSGIIRCI